MTSPSEILTRAAHRLTDETWTQKAVARDADGLEIAAWSPYACQWCLIGVLAYEINAVGKLYEKGESEQLLRVVVAAAGITMEALDDHPEPYLADWNDAPERTVWDVRDLLHRAAWQLTEGE